MGGSGGKARAGSVDFTDFTFEFFNCTSMPSLINPFPDTDCVGNVNQLYLEVLLDFRPGGIPLKKNQETFVTFCIDFE
jgi:hypothetical protein